jgi:hypothetical protein
VIDQQLITVYPSPANRGKASIFEIHACVAGPLPTQDIGILYDANGTLNDDQTPVAGSYDEPWAE